jgi:sulfide dehydrogenase cytochrome subunit
MCIQHIYQWRPDMRTSIWWTAACVALTFSGHCAQAQTPPPPGQLLASNCFQCHGTNGNGPGFDRLAGMPAGKLYEEMLELRAGKGNSLMVKHSLIYTDAQLQQIAAWFAAQPPVRASP